MSYILQYTNHLAAFILISLVGNIEARGLVYASKSWPDGKLDIRTALLSLLCFIGGYAVYLFYIKVAQEAGIKSVHIQSLIWIVVLVCTLGISESNYIAWQWLDKVILFIVVAGVVWLVTQVN